MEWVQSWTRAELFATISLDSQISPPTEQDHVRIHFLTDTLTLPCKGIREKNYILRLPTSLFLVVSEYITPTECAYLAQTTKSIRNIINQKPNRIVALKSYSLAYYRQRIHWFLLFWNIILSPSIMICLLFFWSELLVISVYYPNLYYFSTYVGVCTILFFLISLIPSIIVFRLRTRKLKNGTLDLHWESQWLALWGYPASMVKLAVRPYSHRFLWIFTYLTILYPIYLLGFAAILILNPVAANTTVGVVIGGFGYAAILLIVDTFVPYGGSTFQSLHSEKPLIIITFWFAMNIFLIRMLLYPETYRLQSQQSSGNQFIMLPILFFCAVLVIFVFSCQRCIFPKKYVSPSKLNPRVPLCGRKFVEINKCLLVHFLLVFTFISLFILPSFSLIFGYSQILAPYHSIAVVNSQNISIHEAPILPLTPFFPSTTTKYIYNSDDGIDTDLNRSLWFLPGTFFLNPEEEQQSLNNETVIGNCLNYALYNSLYPSMFLIDQIGEISNETILQLLLSATNFPPLEDKSLILISPLPIYNLDITQDACTTLTHLYDGDYEMCEKLMLLLKNNVSIMLLLVDIETAIQLRSFGQAYDCSNNIGKGNNKTGVGNGVSCQPVSATSLSLMDCIGSISVVISSDPFPGSPALMPNYFQVPVIIPLAFLFLAQISSLNIILFNRLRLHQLRYFVPDPNRPLLIKTPKLTTRKVSV